MKKIVASVGLVALASSLTAVQGQDAAPPYKPWNVSATLRGTYDDNISAQPSGPNKVGSMVYEASPGVSWNLQNDQTRAKASYVYTYKYYDKEPVDLLKHYSQDHEFNGSLNHSFNERYQLGVRDSFVIGQEPDQLRATLFSGVPFQPVPGDNIRNYGTIVLDAEFTRLFGIEVGYENELYDYHADLGNSGGTFPSLSGLLDRLVHRVHLDGRWQVLPQTVGILGYQYEQTDYTGNEPIGFGATGEVFSEVRNSRSQYGYVGVDHNFLPDLSGSIRVGARYTDYYNMKENDMNPYVRANLQYNYAVESHVDIGLSYDHTATDVLGSDTVNGFASDIEAFVLYGSIVHRIVPDLYGSLIAQFQSDTYNHGNLNNQSEEYYMLGLDLKYRFNPYLSANIGYNYDRLNASVTGQTFDRNRVYIGITGTY